ncbi:hypothetical protein N8H41_05425 [Pseudomonas vlassakiae]|uniref:hypothetical protein n=1 Tax=Pseudomonas TaxID=286 RepID=UPI000ED26C0F|nr:MULTISPECIES: hypothetical protein [Pseudomonas]MCU0123415.1 hypothetical protein [Pseudomonas vlassakiae]HCV41074.1 hypothetical protein [Pseudomonas sp.]
MRVRGNVFWDWADPTLHHRSHDETLDDGTHIDVQVRLSRTGQTQMFIGVYAPQGMAVHEESFAARPGESMTRAMAWGVGRARKIAVEGVHAVIPTVAAG